MLLKLRERAGKMLVSFLSTSEYEEVSPAEISPHKSGRSSRV